MSSTPSTFLSHSSSLSRRWSSECGVIGACLYIAGFVLPLQWDIPLLVLALWDIPLLVLALMSTLTIITSSRNGSPSWSPLTISVLVFLATVGLSTLVSLDVSRSVRLSVSLLVNQPVSSRG